MRVELLENTERRRRWSFDDKARIVEASFETGVSVCSVARRHGIAQGLLFTWRRQARDGRLGGDAQAPVLVPVAIAPEPSLRVPAAQSDDPRTPAPPRRPRRRARCPRPRPSPEAYVGQRMVGFGQAMRDAVLVADAIEHVPAVEGCRA
ncbi:IS66-like element accessory protein TnpA [Methylobacterium sp. J-077]|uniref:IS66-like element accessory protein TnpA n=1 Tax=Methylobacterium sp. J-077 TaxID=2836656 RepID=UPI001FBABD9A|nr:transposase [Methylobacterium sp. J-077]MCJ2121188.1 transposase [Methylobacterium sp. J-077]